MRHASYNGKQMQHCMCRSALSRTTPTQDRLADVLATRRQREALRNAFAAWHAYAQSDGRIPLQVAHARLQRSLVRRRFVAWARSCSSETQRMAGAAAWNRRRLQLSCLRSWRQAHRQTRQCAHAAERFAHDQQRRQLTQALRAWRSLVGRRAANEARRARACVHWQRRHVKTAVASWAQIVYERRHARGVAHTRYKQRCTTILAQSVLAWRVHVQAATDRHQRAHAMASRAQRRLLRRAFATWRTEAQTATQALLAADAARQIHSVSCMRGVWSHWLAHVQHQRAAAEGALRCVLGRQGADLLQWGVAPEGGKKLTMLCQCRLLLRVRTRELAESFDAWRAVVERRAAIRQAAERMQRRRCGALARRALLGWRAAVASQGDTFGVLCELTAHAQQRRVLLGAWHTWRDATFGPEVRMSLCSTHAS